MLLCELFDNPADIVGDMRSLMTDILTPLAANGVEEVTVQQVIDRLREVGTGLYVDRALVMAVLDPDEVELIQKIEGDRVVLDIPVSDTTKSREDVEEENKNRISDKAGKQAQKEVSRRETSPGVRNKIRDSL